MMTKYYKDTSNNLLVDPILTNHYDLTEITATEFNESLIIKNTPTADQLLAREVADKKAYLLSTDYKVLSDYDGDTEGVLEARAAARAFIRLNEVTV